MKRRPSKKYLKSVLRYNRRTGIFYWKKSPSNNVRAGDVAGTVKNPPGYIAICIKNRRYYAHAIAWMLVYGRWPKEVDHKNRNKSDNRISNLRLATSSQNHINTGLPRHNTSGAKGVFWHRKARKWQAQIQVDGSMIYLGLHRSKTAAILARRAASKLHFGAFAA